MTARLKEQGEGMVTGTCKESHVWRSHWSMNVVIPRQLGREGAGGINTSVSCSSHPLIS